MILLLKIIFNGVVQFVFNLLSKIDQPDLNSLNNRKIEISNLSEIYYININ